MITEEKLKKLDDPIVVEVLFDILHMKNSKFPQLNLGQHADYKEIVKELKKRYQKKLDKEKEL